MTTFDFLKSVMAALLKKKWIWITLLFLTLNSLGLLKIISVLEHRNPKSKTSQSSQPEHFGLGRPLDSAKVEFKVTSVTPKAVDGGSYLEISFSKQLSPDAAKGYVSVNPEKAIRIEQSYWDLKVYGDFKPGETCTVEVLKGLPSEDGSKLAENKTETVAFPDYEPSLSFKTNGQYLLLDGSQTVSVEVVNIDKLEASAARVYDNNLVYLLNNMGYGIPDDLGPDVVTKTIDVKLKHNEKGEVPVQIRDVLKGNAKGLFFLTVKAATEGIWESESRVILATDIGIVAKKSNNDLFVWVNRLSTAGPMVGATVKAYSKTNQQILEGNSDGNGFLHFKDVDWSGDKKPFVVTAAGTGDLSFIKLEETVLSETDLAVDGRPYLSSGYEAFVYGDRNLYRPGETVHIRAIIRGRGVSLPGTFPVLCEIKRPDGKIFKKLNGLTGKAGIAEWDVEFPVESLTGDYEAAILIPGTEKPAGAFKFQLEEFMPARLSVKLNVQEKRYTIAGVVTAEVQALQSFGSAAADKNVELAAVLRPKDFAPVDYKGYSFKDETIEFSEKKIPIEGKRTGPDGKASFEFKLPEQPVLVPSSAVLAIGATVRETGGRAVTAHEERAFDPYPVYVGVRKKIEGNAGTGKNMDFEFVVLSPEGKPIIGDSLKVTVNKVNWESVLKKDKQGAFQWTSVSHEDEVHSTDVNAGNGSGTFTFTPKSYGDHILRVRTKGGHSVSLKFYVEGPWAEAMPWAMERPDRIELQLDKAVYKEGDSAKLLIKAPFKGKALVTVTQDRVLSAMVVNLTEATQQVTLPVDASFSPNAYCSVTVIRPIVKGEKWAAHRAYGVIPIMLVESQHKLGVIAKLPESARPGEKVKVELSVQRDSKLVSDAELSVALVDEGILLLTAYETPNPYDFFYGKRAHGVETSDYYSLLIPEPEDKKISGVSSPGGDGGYDAKDHLNPIAVKRVVPVALWQSNIRTDDKGQAFAEFTIPKEFTGKLRLMTVASSDKDFGNGEAKMKVASPLMVEASLPRFLAPGDQFITSVSVFNETGTAGEAKVTLEVPEGFKVISDTEATVTAKAGVETIVKFNVEASANAGKAAIKVTAKLGSEQADQTTELSVRPAAAYTVLGGSGAIKAPGKAEVKLPTDWLKGTESQSLIVSSLPSVQFLGALKYLIEYPYGCVEQTTSTVYPLLYLKEVLPVLDQNKFSASGIDRNVQVGINRLFSMQNYSGGFGMWQGDSEPYDYGSVYAMEFLAEAQKAGYAVPKDEFRDALEYLEKIVSGKAKDDGANDDLRSHALYVLAKAGRMKSSWIRRLQEKQKDLSEFGKLYLAGSLALMGEKKAMTEITGQGFGDKAFSSEKEGEFLVIPAAVALSVFMDMDPENPLVPVLVKRLQGLMKDGQWGTTQNNAQALIGLGKYTRFLKGQAQDFTGRILAGGKPIASFSDKASASLNGAVLSGDITIEVSGAGTAYYYWTSGGVPVSGKVEEKDSGLEVRRSFLDAASKPVDLTKLKQGDVVIVDITLESGLSCKNVVVSDLLPAGLEVENPRLSASDTSDLSEQEIIVPQKIDIRDDRVLIFADVANLAHYRYVARAVTPGRFKLPALNAESMYDPSIASVNGAGEIVIAE